MCGFFNNMKNTNFLKIYFYFMYIDILPYMCLNTTCMHCSWRPEEVIGSLGTRVLGLDL